MKSLPNPNNKSLSSRSTQKPSKPKKRYGKPKVNTALPEDLNHFAHSLSTLLKQTSATYHHEDPYFDPIISPLNLDQIYRLCHEITSNPNHTFFSSLVSSLQSTSSKPSLNQLYWAHRLAMDVFYRNSHLIKPLLEHSYGSPHYRQNHHLPNKKDEGR